MSGKRAILSERLVTPEGVRPGCLVLAGGRIEAVLPELPRGFSGETEDFGGLAVLPGLVDTHVHVNEPGRTEWEGFETATHAAAAGGITTLLDMPLNCIPVTTSADALDQKLRAVRGKLFVDTGFWGGVTPRSLGELEGLLAHENCFGVKSFLIDSGIEEFPPVTERDLDVAMPLLARADLPYLFHAELALPGEEGGAMGAGYEGFLRSRPDAWETRAVELIAEKAKRYGGPCHIVHLSSTEALLTVLKAKRAGARLTAETCPHYLCLTSEWIERESPAGGRTVFKCCPPIRSRKNREGLWHALESGVLDFIVSDHSPCTPSLKLLEEGDFEKGWGGIASLQFTLPLIWTECGKRRHSLAQLSHWMSAAPARMAGLEGRKGTFAPGADADFLVFDPEAEIEVREEDVRHRHKLVPYRGWKLRGRVVSTHLRGKEIYGEGGFSEEILGKPLSKKGSA